MDSGFSLALMFLLVAACFEIAARAMSLIGDGEQGREARRHLREVQQQLKEAHRELAETRKLGAESNRRSSLAARVRAGIEKTLGLREQRGFEAVVEIGEPVSGRRLFRAVVTRSAGAMARPGAAARNPIWRREVQAHVWARSAEDARFILMARFPATMNYTISYPTSSDTDRKSRFRR